MLKDSKIFGCNQGVKTWFPYYINWQRLKKIFSYKVGCQ